MNHGDILRLIEDALAQVWESKQDRIVAVGIPSFDRSTQLLGGAAVLDSLGLVELILEVETRLRERGYSVTLTSEEAFSRSRSPFRIVATLAEYVEEQIEHTRNG